MRERTWSYENGKICPRCKIRKSIEQFGFYKSGKKIGTPRDYCRKCDAAKGMERAHRNGRVREMSKAKDCSNYLGICIAEKVLSNYFEDVVRMPNNNPGYDFICKRGYKIDAKSGCLLYGERVTPTWCFSIKRNNIPDYFMLLAFDDRNSLNPLHIWLIPGNELNMKMSLGISTLEKSIAKWSQYEKPIDKVISCCNMIKGDKI